MIKFVIALVLTFVGSSVYAGECASGRCPVRSRVVNVTREVISVPVVVTRKAVEATRTIGRRTVSRVRDVVR
jgi:hypothetical protein